MKRLFGFAILHASTVCQNQCSKCPFAEYKPAIAPLDYMKEVALYMKSRYYFPVIDITGKDVSHNPNLIAFLRFCREIGVTTSVTLGTSHSVAMAKDIFELTNYPRISFDGPEEDLYRGLGNYKSFLALMQAAKEAGALKRLMVVFTAIPGQNLAGDGLRTTLETVRKLGRGYVKLLVNLLNTAGYSPAERKTLRDLRWQAQVQYSLAKRILYRVDGESKGCLCHAPEILTFGADQTLIAPCGLLPFDRIDIKNGIESAVRSKERARAARLCGSHETCKTCWATCYHLPGRFLRPDLRYLLAHLPSLSPIQGARDFVLTQFGQLKINPEDRHPNCPRLGEAG